MTSESGFDPRDAKYPGHESYRSDSSAHPKPQGLWMSEKGDNGDVWVEFELPEVVADCIEHNVRWKDVDLESLSGKTVRLYIMVQDADLYGFRFR